MEKYQVSYLWTREELRKAIRHHQRAQLRPSLQIAFCGLLLFVAAMSCVLMVVDGLQSRTVVFGTMTLFFTVYWLTLRNWINVWWALRGFDKNPAANTLIQWDFSDEEISMTCPGLQSFTADWKMFSNVVERDDGFLLYTFPKQLFYWLPFSGFAGEAAIDGFRRLVEERLCDQAKSATA